MGTTTGFKERYLNARNRRWINALVWVGTSLLAFVILVQPGATRPSSYTLSAGDVAQQEIQAPYTLEYVSDLLTNQARSDAEQRVGLVYLPADPAISRKQLEHLRTALNFIDAVRFDGYASIEEKLADLALLENLKLTEPDALAILSLNEVRWEAVSRESLAVLEAVMRDTIRDDQTRDAVRRIPTLISFTLPQDQASIVNTLVTPFITANSLLEESLTQQARQEARDKVSPVTKKYIAGETIINRGQVISPLIWEALVQYNLVRSQTTTQDYFSALALVATTSIFLALYFNRRKLSFENNLRGLFLLCILFLVFLFLARFVIPNRVVIPYIFPIPAFALTVAILFNLELSLIFSLVLSLLTAFGMPNALDLTSFYILSSMISVLVLGKGQRISNFFWAGLAIALTGSATTLAYRLSNPYTDLNGFVTLIAAVFVNGFASASLSLLFQYGFSQWVGVTTAIQLLEISRPDHPLLQFILQNAPGSYQHSLQVAVLAEQAAEKIGADAMLVRVGGLYHDAGKALNPSFFIENQEGAKLNTHDDLEPEESARIILRHVTDGVGLARKYRIPNRIQDFMREHHGTLLTRYQYALAVERAGGDKSLVNESLFRYPGPIPASRETALLMLADGCQARVRAELPQSEDEIRKVIRKVIEFCEKEGQLNNTRLTLRDLSLITDSFVETLKNTYHPRIRYPEISPQTLPVVKPTTKEP